MSKVRRSLLLSFAEKYSAFIAQFVATLFVARLLTPTEIGIYSVAVVMVGLAHTVRDFGVGQYLVQERELDPAKVRAAFGVAIAVAWGMALALFAASYPAAAFYGEAGVGEAMRVLVLNFILLPFATVSLALWRREMNFGPPYVIKTTGAVVSAVVVVLLAYLGVGYLSMAWAAVAGISANVLLATWMRPAGMPWLPSLRGSGAVVSWGGLASGAVVLKEIATAAPDLIVGRVLGMRDVGMLGRAMGLINVFERFFSSAVKGIILPHFAEVQRGGRDLRDSYLRTLALTCGVAWPFFAFVAVMASPIIRVLYGDQWGEAVPLTQVLCAYGAIRMLAYFADHTLLAVGLAKRNLVVEAMTLAAVAAAVLLASPYGLRAVTLGLLAASVIGTVVSYRFLRSAGVVTLTETLRASAGSLGLAAATAAGPLALMALHPLPGGPVTLLAAGCALGAAGWGGALWAIRHPLRAEVATYTGRALAHLRRK